MNLNEEINSVLSEVTLRPPARPDKGQGSRDLQRIKIQPDMTAAC